MIEELNIEYDYVDLTQESIDYETLSKLYKELDIPLKKFFNTSGVEYRKHNVKDMFDTSTDEEMLKLICGNGLLLKRPFIIDKKVYIGNKIEEIASDYGI